MGWAGGAYHSSARRIFAAFRLEIEISLVDVVGFVFVRMYVGYGKYLLETVVEKTRCVYLWKLVWFRDGVG